MTCGAAVVYAKDRRSFVDGHHIGNRHSGTTTYALHMDCGLVYWVRVYMIVSIGKSSTVCWAGLFNE